MEYYTKATEILDKKIKEDKIEHLKGKHSQVYETSLKAIIEALILTDVGSNNVELGCEHKWLMKFNSGNFIIGKQCSKCNKYIAY